MTVKEICYMVWNKLGMKPYDESLPSSTVVSMLNSLLHEWAKFFPDTYHEKATSTLSADATTITLPSDFREFDSFWIDDYMYRFIPAKDVTEFGTYAKVCYYTDATFTFYPGADSGATYVLYYYKDPTEVTALTDTPGIPERFHMAMAIALAFLLSPAPTPLLTSQYEKVLRDLKKNRGVGRRNAHAKTMQHEAKNYNWIS